MAVPFRQAPEKGAAAEEMRGDASRGVVGRGVAVVSWSLALPRPPMFGSGMMGVIGVTTGWRSPSTPQTLPNSCRLTLRGVGVALASLPAEVD
mmetsp:Transcript_80927/g.213458  ORF Transcript_80927/g.213458 Transcript_80927/m.213458 type:complete len:93 (+) Transcript_80927:717-995(+)